MMLYGKIERKIAEFLAITSSMLPRHLKGTVGDQETYRAKTKCRDLSRLLVFFGGGETA